MPRADADLRALPPGFNTAESINQLPVGPDRAAKFAQLSTDTTRLTWRRFAIWNHGTWFVVSVDSWANFAARSGPTGSWLIDSRLRVESGSQKRP